MISHRAKNTILSVIFYGCPSVFTFCGGVFGFTHGIWWALGSAVAGLLAGYLLLTVLFFCLCLSSVSIPKGSSRRNRRTRRHSNDPMTTVFQSQSSIRVADLCVDKRKMNFAKKTIWLAEQAIGGILHRMVSALILIMVLVFGWLQKDGKKKRERCPHGFSYQLVVFYDSDQ